jgi:hypothetical protein
MFCKGKYRRNPQAACYKNDIFHALPDRKRVAERADDFNDISWFLITEKTCALSNDPVQYLEVVTHTAMYTERTFQQWIISVINREHKEIPRVRNLDFV